MCFHFCLIINYSDITKKNQNQHNKICDLLEKRSDYCSPTKLSDPY